MILYMVLSIRSSRQGGDVSGESKKTKLFEATSTEYAVFGNSQLCYCIQTHILNATTNIV